MKDQAQRLREIINNMKNKDKYNTLPHDTISHDINDNSIKDVRVITVTSGKGGVGKTNLVINLALALNQLGYKVMVLDADLGLANIDVIVGQIPQYTLVHVIRHEKKLEEIIIEGPNGIKIISGGSGLRELVDLTEKQLMDLLNSLKEIGQNVDFILIDTGAGINQSVLSFVNAAGEIILVCTPEPTSITDAYAMAKNIILEDKEKEIKILVNRARNKQEGIEVFNKLNTASQKFLDTSLILLGYLYEDHCVSQSVRAQTPFLLKYPNSQISQGVELIAKGLVNDDLGIRSFENNSLKKFIHRIFNRYYQYRQK